VDLSKGANFGRCAPFAYVFTIHLYLYTVKLDLYTLKDDNVSMDMTTRFLLGKFLSARDITPNALSVETHGKLSRNAIYNLANNEQPTSVRLSSLDVLIPVLRKMTGERVTVGDLLVYADEQDALFDGQK
jgi:hypothetical protein